MDCSKKYFESSPKNWACHGFSRCNKVSLAQKPDINRYSRSISDRMSFYEKLLLCFFKDFGSPEGSTFWILRAYLNFIFILRHLPLYFIIFPLRTRGIKFFDKRISILSGSYMHALGTFLLKVWHQSFSIDYDSLCHEIMTACATRLCILKTLKLLVPRDHVC